MGSDNLTACFYFLLFSYCSCIWKSGNSVWKPKRGRREERREERREVGKSTSRGQRSLSVTLHPKNLSQLKVGSLEELLIYAKQIGLDLPGPSLPNPVICNRCLW